MIFKIILPDTRRMRDIIYTSFSSSKWRGTLTSSTDFIHRQNLWTSKVLWMRCVIICWAWASHPFLRRESRLLIECCWALCIREPWIDQIIKVLSDISTTFDLQPFFATMWPLPFFASHWSCIGLSRFIALSVSLRCISTSMATYWSLLIFNVKFNSVLKLMMTECLLLHNLIFRILRKMILLLFCLIIFLFINYLSLLVSMFFLSFNMIIL